MLDGQCFPSDEDIYTAFRFLAASNSVRELIIDFFQLIDSIRGHHGSIKKRKLSKGKQWVPRTVALLLSKCFWEEISGVDALLSPKWIAKSNNGASGSKKSSSVQGLSGLVALRGCQTQNLRCRRNCHWLKTVCSISGEEISALEEWSFKRLLYAINEGPRSSLGEYQEPP